MAVETGEYVPGSIWFYLPNKGAAIFFAIAFAASGIVHVWQAIHYQSWRLTGLYVFASVCFTGGFITRVAGAYDPGNLIKFIVSVCMVYAAPPVYELANYNILGRCLYYIPYHSPIHPGRVITTFAFVSAVVEALNGNGVALSANQGSPRWRQDIGSNLLKAALLIQVAVVLCFVWLALTFQRNCARGGVSSDKVRAVLLTLYVSSAIILARTVYRTVEYFGIADLHYTSGMDPATLSPMIRYESFFYCLEALLMLANQVLLNARHPRMWLPRGTRTYLSKADGVTELTGPGYKEHDRRGLIVTVLDPFNLWGAMRGSDKIKQFWDDESAFPPANRPVPASTSSAAAENKDTVDVV